MKALQKTGKIFKFFMATIGSTLFENKPPKLLQDANNVTELEAFVSTLVAMSRPPGLSLVVVKEGEMVYNKSFGLADGPNRIPATTETIYHWGSMTKPTTATAILQLQERGKLNIDDQVRAFLPDLNFQYPSTSSEPITIRHLLNHSAGLKDPNDQMEYVHEEGEPFPNQIELANRLFAGSKKIQFEPGTQASYSNLSYTILGAVVETISGQSHKDYVVENIFHPLGMDNTDYLFSEETRQHAAVGSQPVGNITSVILPIMNIDIDAWTRETKNRRMWFKHGNADFTGAAGVKGPTSDAARFVMAILNGGTFDGTRILTSESVSTMLYENHVLAQSGQTAALYKGIKHGLGWMIWPDGDRLRIMHPGTVPMGFSATMQLYPQENLGIVIHCNEWTSGISFRGDSIVDTIVHLAAGLDW